jgi:hypothetical protein
MMLPMTLRKPVEDFDGGLDQIAQLSQFPSDVFWGGGGDFVFPFCFSDFSVWLCFFPFPFYKLEVC